MNTILPHIMIGLNRDTRVILKIESYELFDFIDDFLGETFNIVFESIDIQKKRHGEIVTIDFPEDITIEKLKNCLANLSPKVIEEIYDANNT